MFRLSKVTTCDPGDVLMVNMPGTDKKTGKPYQWRFFAIVHGVHRNSISCYRVGSMKPIMLDNRSAEQSEIMLLDDNEWPDGIWQVRTQLILSGEIDLSK